LKLPNPKEKRIGAPQARKKEKGGVAPRQIGMGRAGWSGRIYHELKIFCKENNLECPEITTIGRIIKDW